MGLLKDLQTGSAGVTLKFPRDVKVLKDEKSGALLEDYRHHVTWSLVRWPFMLDLREENDILLHQDIEIFARAGFENFFKTSAPESKTFATESPNPPRTSDPRWSPVIEIERRSIKGAPAVRVLRRLAYQPGCEIVIGQLLIPLPDGFFEISGLIRSSYTGMRESVLMMKLLNNRPELTSKTDSVGKDHEDPEERMAAMNNFMQQRSQSDYDDPIYDKDFPEHALSYMRNAFRWLLDPATGLEVRTAPEQPVGEFKLPTLECAITPPARFQYAAVFAQLMKLVAFTRISLPSKEVTMLDVWRAPNGSLMDHSEKALAQFAIKHHRDWKDEGVKIESIETETLPPLSGLTQLNCYIKFFTTNSVHAVARWFIDRDGSVFRLTISAPIFVPKELINIDVENVAKSWRRIAAQSQLSESQASGQNKQKPWWQFW